MSIRQLLFLLCLAGLTGCKSGRHSAGSGTDSTQTTSVTPDDPAGNWYKRLSGTLAGKAIVVQLHRYNGHVQGSYQYTAIGEAIPLTDWDDTIKNPAQLHLTELVAGDATDGAESDGAIWTISLSGSDMSGEWARGENHYPLSLHEEYPAGSTRLKAFYNSDSAALFPGKAASPGATISYSYLMPAGSEGKDFLSDTLLAQLWPQRKAGDDAAALIRTANAKYFEDYRSDNAGEAAPGADADDFALQYTSDEVLTVLYNDGGWLVTEDLSNDYTGGAHGNYGSAFANIDMQQKRVWKISDVITDTTALRPYLAQAVLRYFSLKPGDRMDDRLLVNAVPPTDNFFLSATGITLVYNPYEIASYADGQVKLFLPFRKMMSLLTPAFKTRMGLSENTGVAMR